MIKENIETISEIVIKPMYENGEFSLKLADEIADAIYKRIQINLIDDGAFGQCQCGYEFNSELVGEYDVKYCPSCGQVVDTTLEVQDDSD